MADQILSAQYRQLLKDAMGATYHNQNVAARQFLELLEDNRDVEVVDKTVTLIVETVVQAKSWPFLVEFFCTGGKKVIGQCVVNSLMRMSLKTKIIIQSFVEAVYAQIYSKKNFDIQPASDVLACVLKSETVDAATKVDFVKEIFSLTRKKAFSKGKFDTEEEIYGLFLAAKYALDEMRSDEIDAVLKALQNKADVECQNYSLIIAAHLGRWEMTPDLDKHSILFGNAAMDVFEKAATGRIYKYAASVLQKLLKVPSNPPVYDLLNKMCGCIKKVFETGKNKELLGECLEECRSNRLYGAGALIALWSNDLKEMKKLMMSEIAEGRDVVTILSEVIDRHHWRLVLEIISKMNHVRPEVKERAVSKVLFRAADRCFTPGGKYAIEKLLSDCGARHKKVLEEEVLFQILENCESDLFCTFVARDPIDLSQARVHSMGPTFSAIVITLSQYKQQAAQSRRARKAAEAFSIMMRKCIEAGLTTQPSLASLSARFNPFASTTPLVAAAGSGNLDLVKLLYKTGATCNAELYKLSHDPKLRTELERQEKKDVLDYLDLKASNPRRLQDLCCLTVSRHIGCRSDRKHRALAMGLPMHLVQQILFYDVLF